MTKWTRCGRRAVLLVMLGGMAVCGGGCSGVSGGASAGLGGLLPKSDRALEREVEADPFPEGPNKEAAR